ncbi:hypothetical protein [Streptosporangium sp. NPDC020145]|uniref:hypothetical protein n=1 Tax=Streptosporangium sp. NPDC020145 TaxID=3154694 RepID=UPI00343F2BE0
MIPANPGLVARFEHETENDLIITYRRVEGWDRHGRAVVVGDDDRLIAADEFPNFVGVAEASPPNLHIGFIPGQGWRLRYEHPETGEAWTEPVVGFAFTADGQGVPLEEMSGVVSPAEGGTYRLLPPDEPKEPNTLRPVR